MLCGTGARVRIGNVTSERFVTSSGIRQGCVLAPALFNDAIIWAMEHACCHGVKGIVVGGHVFADLDYADDIALQSASRDEPLVSLDFARAAGTMGFKVSWHKTKVQYRDRLTRRASCRCFSMGLRHGHSSLQIIYTCRLFTCAASDASWG